MNPRERAVRKLFSRIARPYGLLNSIISLGMHRSWRRAAMRRLSPQPGMRCLDICAGTGDFSLALEAAGCEAVAFDMTPEMLAVAADRADGDLAIVVGDALHMPFADASFDAATVGFGLRHARSDLKVLLQEARRVLKPGAKLVSLELSHPPSALWAWITNLYIHLLIPFIGAFVDPEAYRYLSESLQGYPDAPTLAEMFEDAGFSRCEYRLLGGGVAAIHIAEA